jgi:dienelactone hydrolase
VLVRQEIYGVNSHIRADCDENPNEGYDAIATALFDRATRNI